MTFYKVLEGDEVVTSIAKNIRSVFSKDELPYVYKDPIHQGFKVPCVFIDSFAHNHSSMTRFRAEWYLLIQLRCHPPEHVPRDSYFRKLYVKMLDAVESIEVSDQTVRAIDIQSRIKDGVLLIDITYKFNVRKVPEDLPDMEQLDLYYGVDKMGQLHTHYNSESEGD